MNSIATKTGARREDANRAEETLWYKDKAHLLLPTLVTRSFHGLSLLLVAQLTILDIINAPRRAVQPCHGDIALLSLSQAIGADSRMPDTSHYGAGRSIIMRPCPKSECFPLP